MVHDSDIACYWLFENGRILDEYNSCPDYFADSDDEPAGPAGGDPDLLLPLCKPGTSAEQLTEILTSKEVFAERTIELLADALGIDRGRALADYNSIQRGEDPDEDGFDGDDEDDGGSGPGLRLVGQVSRPAEVAKWAEQYSKLLGLASANAPADPQAVALVEAAAANDTAAIDRLLAAGAAIDAEAPVSPPTDQMETAGQLLAGQTQKMSMTPLLAAMLHRKPAAIKLLLDHGADPNRLHPLFGAATHVAVGQGDVELLQQLIDRGADLTLKNARGQTPSDVITAGRAAGEQLAKAKAMLQSLGGKVPPVFQQLAKANLPTEGWSACEQLLRSR